MKTIAAFAILIVTSGCATRYVPHTEIFARQHPKEAQLYTALAPTSPEYIAYIDDQHRDTMSAVISNLEKKKDDPAKLEEYISYLKRVHSASDFRSYPEWSSLTNRLQKGDSLYLFDYSCRVGEAWYSDNGLLVLRDGNVAYRTPDNWSISQKTGGTNEPPKETKIDRL